LPSHEAANPHWKLATSLQSVEKLGFGQVPPAAPPVPAALPAEPAAPPWLEAGSSTLPVQAAMVREARISARVLIGVLLFAGPLCILRATRVAMEIPPFCLRSRCDT